MVTRQSNDSLAVNLSTFTLTSHSASGSSRSNSGNPEKLPLSIPSPARRTDVVFRSRESRSLSTTSNAHVFLSEPPMGSSSPPQPSKSQRTEAAFIFITCIAQFLSLSALNQTVSPVLILAEYFDVQDFGNLSWFSASYSMSVGTFILPAGMLASHFKHVV